MANKTYEDGLVDSLRLYGNVCSSYGSCASCPVSQLLRGESCTVYARQNPNGFLSALQQASNTEHSYYNEYITRFPDCTLSIDEISKSICRKAVFEGYISCQGGDCKSCWLEKYGGDVTVFNQQTDVQNQQQSQTDDFPSQSLSNMFGESFENSDSNQVNDEAIKGFTNFAYIEN